MRFVATVFACALVGASPSWGQEPAEAPLAPGEAIPPAALEDCVDDFIGDAMADRHIVGVSVSVVQDGRVALNKGYGLADIETGHPVDPDTTLFRIGSITKTLTWVALMAEAEAGRIDLDDPVNDHLPEGLRIPDQGFEEPIRIRHLLTHSAGFEDRALGFLFAVDPARMSTLDERLRIGRPDRVRAAGELSSYSNYGAALAGAALAHAAGKPWQEVIEERILAPLGMTHTSAREPYPPRADLPAPMSSALSAELASGYRWTSERHERRTFEYLTPSAPAGVISSTSGDMARFMLMLLGGGALDGTRVLDPQTAAAFRTPMTELPPEVGNWAAGFLELPAPSGFRSTGHDGGTAAFFSNMRLYPELGLGVFVTANTAGGMALTGRLPDAIVERFYAEPANAQDAAAPGDPAAARAYVGRYRLTRREHSRLGGFISRMAVFPVRATDDGFLAVSVPGASARYAPGDRPGRFDSADGAEESWLPPTLIFESRDGRMQAETPSFALERVGALQSPLVIVLPGLLTVVASLAALIGWGARLAGSRREASLHPRAEQLQLVAAGLWLASAAGLAMLGAEAAADPYRLLSTWPTASILVFSTAALAAGFVSLAGSAFVPAVWRRSPSDWSAWRKARFTTTAALFVVYAALLQSWGALQPWNP